MDSAEILVIGGSGRVGGELVALLCAADIPCRVLLRPSSGAPFQTGDGVSIGRGDLADPSSLEAALTGIRRVFLLSRDQPLQAGLEGNLVRVAARTGVERIVKLSAFAAGLQPPAGYGITHAESELTLKDSDLDWTILRPCMYMQNLLDIADLVRNRGLIPLPLGEGKVGFIDARDVALAAKVVLTGDGHAGKIYELTGPQVLGMEECARTMSTLLAKEVRYRSPPWWLAGLMMRLQGVSAWDVKMRKQLFRMIKDDGEAMTTGDFESITGRLPRSFDQFARDHLQHFCD